MRKTSAILAGIVSGFVINFNLAQASPDLSAQLQAVEQTALTPAAEVPRTGQFYSARMANAGLIYAPILPGGMGLDAWSLGDNVWLVNDLETVTPLRDGMRMMAMDGGLLPPGAGGGGGATNTHLFNGIQFDTNSLYLEITNIASGVGYANLHHATNQVYAILSATNLTVPLAGWQVETEVWPADTNCQPFTVATLDRQNLFLRAQDWTGVTAHGNTVPNWWLWNFFKTTDLSDTNLDDVGNSLLLDYEHGFDPNLIQFSLRFASAYVAASPVAGTIDLWGGEPAYMAVLVNDTNQAHAVWQSYSPSVVASLTAGDGVYTVMVGLRGLAPNATPSWLETTLTLDTAPLILTVTNPALNTVAQPLVQLQGFASRPLASLTYDLTNAAIRSTNQPGFVTGQAYDTNLLASASYFQCYDLALTNGVNLITLHATDVFGHAATTNVSFTLDYGSGANPVISLLWPANNAVVAGTNFTLQGSLDDATASVVVHTGTNHFPALVERSGRFSVPNLPLSGTNVFTVAVTNAAGRGISQTLTVLQSPVSVTLNPVSAAALAQEPVNLTGTLSDPNHDVYVNGFPAVVNDDSIWAADFVPVSDEQGNGRIVVEVYPLGGDPGATPPTATQQIPLTLPPRLQAVSYMEQVWFDEHVTSCFGGTGETMIQHSQQWSRGMGGDSVTSESFSTGGGGGYSYTLPDYWPEGQPWENIAAAVAGPATLDVTCGLAQRTITRQAGTAVQLVASGPAQAGAGAQLIHLLVSAAGYSDLGMNAYSGNFYIEPGMGAGDVPVPAANLRIAGHNLAAVATNDYLAEIYLVLPAGAAQLLPLSVTGTNAGAYSFDGRAEPVNFQLTVVSNSATQIDGTNWAVVKSSAANDYVYVQAMLDTTNTAALAMASTAM